MIDYSRFLLLREKHGYHASWAVWAQGVTRPKERVGDLRIFETAEDGDLLRRLNPNIVLVGLNISRPVQFPLGNFHDGRPGSMDYKIRYAVQGTVLWGAYMTDVIKDFEQRASGRVMAHFRNNKDFARQHLDAFRAELQDLGSVSPTLVAFGRDAYQILEREFGRSHQVLRVPHYSDYTSKEVYREQVASAIESMTSRLSVGGDDDLPFRIS